MKKNSSDENWIKLLTWTAMDGTMVDSSKYAKNPANSSQKRIQFKLSKTRKLMSLMGLLNEMKITYTVKAATKSGENKLQPYVIRIYGDHAKDIFSRLHGSKSIPSEWADLTYENAQVFLQTLEETDGYRDHDRISWAATDAGSMNTVKALLQKHDISWSDGYTSSGFDRNKKIPKMSIKYKTEWYGRKTLCDKTNNRF